MLVMLLIRDRLTLVAAAAAIGPAIFILEAAGRTSDD